MNIRYDRKTDVLTIEFSAAAVAESDEDKPGIILDYDADGSVVGIEILHYSKKAKDVGRIIIEGMA